MSNYIEKFIVDIGFNTSKTKREAKEIDKLLDSVAGKKRKAAIEEAKIVKKTAKEKQTANKQIAKEAKLEQQRVAMVDKAIAKRQKAEQQRKNKLYKLEASQLKSKKKLQASIDNAKVKQDVSKLTEPSGNRINPKTSVFDPVDTEGIAKQRKAILANERLKDERQRKRDIAKRQRRAALDKRRRSEDKKSYDLSQKDLRARLASYKQSKKTAQAVIDKQDKALAAKQALASKEALRKKAFDKQAEKRQDKRNKRRGKLKQSRLKDERATAKQAKEDFMDRVAIYKRKQAEKRAAAEEAAKPKVNPRYDTKRTARMGETMRNSRAYMGKDKAIAKGLLRRDIKKDIDVAIKTGDLRRLTKYKYELQDATKKLNKMNIATKSVSDSTRNMFRAYMSVFALFEGTVAIKNIGMDFQGMEAAMLAASGSTAAAGKDLAFVNGMVDEMGLNLKDTTDAFVKFKFAAKGKMDNGQIEELFESVSMFGTALKVAPQDMIRAQRA